MEYKGKLAHEIHTEPFAFDYVVTTTEYVKSSRQIPENIYEITQALKSMSETEIIKVMKCIMRVTNKRFTFDTRTKA